MKRLLALTVSFLLIAQVGFAAGIGPNSENVTDATGDTAIYTSNTLGYVLTKSFSLKSSEDFSVSYKVTSASGTPDVEIELEQSWDKPLREGEIDNDWVEPENISNIETSLTSETQHHKAISPVALPLARFKIWNNGSNPTDTYIEMKISRQEK